jgi:serine protease Do
MPYALVLVAQLASIVTNGQPVFIAGRQEASPQIRTLFEKRLGVWLGDADGSVLVLEVAPKTGASSLREGDVLTEFDGERLRDVDQFAALVRQTPFGQSVHLGLLRAGELRRVPALMDAVEIRRRIAPFISSLRREGAFLRQLPAGGTERVGIDVQALTPQLADYFGTRGGVLVSAIRASSPADRAGLQAGDVITGIEGKVIRTDADLEQALRRDLSGTELTITITRDREKRTVAVPVSDYRP